MANEVEMGGPEEDEGETPLEKNPAITDPDEYYAKNAFRIVYQTNNFFLPQLKDLIERGEVLNLRPEYQRRLRWKTPQKSKLIESLLLNIPIPPVFLFETEAARYEVMDGQQRLNAVQEFLSGDYALSSLPVLTPLNTLRYSRCPPRIKRALDRSSLSAIVLLLESRGEGGTLKLSDIRRFIFDRLNTGGTKLNPQEIRNALNPGAFNKLIVEITRFSLFTTVFSIPAYVETDPNDYYENPERQKNTLYSTMGDCQLVLRYFALKDDGNIRGSMKSMLDRAMQVELTPIEAQTLKDEFKTRFTFLFSLFDSEPFLLPPDKNGEQRVSAAIYDASMVAINDLWDHRDAIQSNASAVKTRMANALNNPITFFTLVGQQNTALAVKDRIKLMRAILRWE